MQTVRISILPPKKAAAGATVVLERLDAATGRFVALPGATAVLAADLSIKPALPDPTQPAVDLTPERVAELAALAPVPPEVGLYLHHLLLGGKLASAWADARRTPMRLLLRVGQDPRLQALPWERAHDVAGDYLALAAASPLVRWAEPAAGLPERVDDWPMRVLIVHATRPGGSAGAAARVAATDEMLALEQMFANLPMRHNVEYDVLEHPSRQKLLEECRKVRPHVLHVIAHAQAAGNGGELLLWQPGAAGQPGVDDTWRAADIRLQMQDIAPRLVFLNACESGSGGASGVGNALPLASLTQAFLQAGSAATLGMQGEVAGDLACAYAVAFYAALARDQGADVDAAAQQARLAMAGHRTGASVTTDADWAFPVLTRCVPHDAVLPRAPGSLRAPAADRFVARLPQRREAHAALRCHAQAVPAGDSEHLVVVVGEAASGKSYLAEWAAQACRRAGMGVAAISFNPQDKVDWLDALRWLRDGTRRQAGSGPLRLAPVADWPLSPAAFGLFNWALNQRLEGLPTFDAPAAAHAAAGLADEGRALSASLQPSETLIEDTFTAFRDALVECSRPPGLLLKLDQLDGIDAQSFASGLTEFLIKPVAAGRLSGVRMLLVLEKAHWAQLAPRLPQRPRVIDVPFFQQGDFERVARQYCHQWSPTLYGMPSVRGFLNTLAFGTAPEPARWGSDVLVKLATVLSLLARQQEAVT